MRVSANPRHLVMGFAQRYPPCKPQFADCIHVAAGGDQIFDRSRKRVALASPQEGPQPLGICLVLVAGCVACGQGKLASARQQNKALARSHGIAAENRPHHHLLDFFERHHARAMSQADAPGPGEPTGTGIEHKITRFRKERKEHAGHACADEPDESIAVRVAGRPVHGKPDKENHAQSPDRILQGRTNPENESGSAILSDCLHELQRSGGQGSVRWQARRWDARRWPPRHRQRLAPNGPRQEKGTDHDSFSTRLMPAAPGASFLVTILPPLPDEGIAVRGGLEEWGSISARLNMARE